jgi:hypothetical protein
MYIIKLVMIFYNNTRLQDKKINRSKHKGENKLIITTFNIFIAIRRFRKNKNILYLTTKCRAYDGC